MPDLVVARRRTRAWQSVLARDGKCGKATADVARVVCGASL